MLQQEGLCSFRPHGYAKHKICYGFTDVSQCVCVSVSHLVTTVSFTKRLNRLSMFMWEPCIGGRTPRGKDNFGGYVPAHCKM